MKRPPTILIIVFFVLLVANVLKESTHGCNTLKTQGLTFTVENSSNSSTSSSTSASASLPSSRVQNDLDIWNDVHNVSTTIGKNAVDGKNSGDGAILSGEDFVGDPMSKDEQNQNMKHDSKYPNNRVSPYLPKTLYMIYGLESSGTTFVAKLIASSLKIPPVLNPDTVESKDRTIHIQHISLPLGGMQASDWGFSRRFSHPLPIEPVYYPTGCRVPHNGRLAPAQRPVNVQCVPFMGVTVQSPPSRFFVNITSSVRWYRERGVRVHPIMVVRDPSFHFEGIIKMHCPNPEAAYVQYQMGREIMLQSLEQVNPVIVSYESLMTLQGPYLQEIYKKVDINSTYLPVFSNGNLKYAGKSHYPEKIMENFDKHARASSAARAKTRDMTPLVGRTRPSAHRPSTYRPPARNTPPAQRPPTGSHTVN